MDWKKEFDKKYPEEDFHCCGLNTKECGLILQMPDNIKAFIQPLLEDLAKDISETAANSILVSPMVRERLRQELITTASKWGVRDKEY
jgi:hypothetical protein